MVVFLGGPWWEVYDAMHPKRVGFQYTYNVGRFNLCALAIVALSGNRGYCMHGRALIVIGLAHFR
jgi:hypothetical protein